MKLAGNYRFLASLHRLAVGALAASLVLQVGYLCVYGADNPAGAASDAQWLQWRGRSAVA